jgi:hypothetical protein
MPRKLLPLFFLLLNSNVLAFEFPIQVTEYIDDVKIDAYINQKDIAEDTQWMAFETPPPLSIQQALAAVQDFIRADNRFSDATLISIELKRIPHHESYWHYVVKARTKLDNEYLPHFFVVLMDGKVISAIKEPDSIK